jgi:hypothetical protein
MKQQPPPRADQPRRVAAEARSQDGWRSTVCHGEGGPCGRDLLDQAIQQLQVLKLGDLQVEGALDVPLCELLHKKMEIASRKASLQWSMRRKPLLPGISMPTC